MRADAVATEGSARRIGGESVLMLGAGRALLVRRAFPALAVATLAPELRALYGIRVSRRDGLIAAGSAPALRGALPLMPSRLRHVSDQPGHAGLPLVLLRVLAG